ncbi:hypothetical protein EYR40_010007 [Pleurotus pulmonarius]|nr:hypothetical protein EYR36_010600 [Pleurotus pulmonarius]KAF4588456.1 hypothetical protein EYR40_010007 [Pleurotus pulmonarius]
MAPRTLKGKAARSKATESGAKPVRGGNAKKRRAQEDAEDAACRRVTRASRRAADTPVVALPEESSPDVPNGPFNRSESPLTESDDEPLVAGERSDANVNQANDNGLKETSNEMTMEIDNDLTDEDEDGQHAKSDYTRINAAEHMEMSIEDGPPLMITGANAVKDRKAGSHDPGQTDEPNQHYESPRLIQKSYHDSAAGSNTQEQSDEPNKHHESPRLIKDDPLVVQRKGEDVTVGSDAGSDDDGLRLMSSKEKRAIEQGAAVSKMKEANGAHKTEYLSCRAVADELLEHYSLRAIRRFEDAWKAASLSAYKQRHMPLGPSNQDDSRKELVECVRMADVLIRKACKAQDVKEKDLEEQLHHIKWPKIDVDTDMITFDVVVATVNWFAKYMPFKIKRQETKKKERPRNDYPAFYHTLENGTRAIRFLTQLEAQNTMAHPHANPGVLEIAPEDAANVFITCKGFTTCISHKKNPVGYVNCFKLSDNEALNCGCAITSGLLELWLEKTAAAAGTPVRGDPDVVFNSISWTPERLQIVEAAVFELCGLTPAELFCLKEQRLIRTAEWALSHLNDRFSLRPGAEELEAALDMFRKGAAKINRE